MTAESPPVDSRSFRFQALVLFLFSFWLLAFQTGSASLWNIDEPNNAQALKEMLTHANLVVPTFNGHLRPDKPILNYWLMYAGVRLLGMDSWGLRIGSVTLGALLVLYLALALRRLLGAQAALLAGLFTATALHSQILFRAAVPDPLLVLSVTVALVSYLRGYLFPEERNRDYAAAYVAMALGTLAKGPVAFLLPGLIITVFLLVRKDLAHLWREGRLVWGIPLFVLITLPWYVAVGLETRWQWDTLFLAQQNVGRYTGAMQGHKGPVVYYLFTIFLGLLPWSVFLPQALAGAWRHRGPDGWRSRPELLFLGLWALLWTAFFSLGATKLPNYVWEAYPPLLALLGWRVDAALREDDPLSRRGILVSLGFLALVGAALVLLVATLVPEAIPPLGSVAYLGLPYLAGALLALAFAWRGSLTGILGGLGSAAVALTFCLELLLAPSLDALKPSVAMGHLIRGLEGPAPYSLATWHWWEPSFLFYAGRGAMRAQQIHNPGKDIPGILATRPGPLFLVLPAKDLARLRRSLSATVRLHELYAGFELYNRQDIALVKINGK